MSCSVGHRCGSDPSLLWLWPRPVAMAPIRPLPWKPPYAEGVAQENGKKTKKKSHPVAAFHSQMRKEEAKAQEDEARDPRSFGYHLGKQSHP